MKRKGKILLALLAVALLVCIATVTLVACGENEDSEPSNPQGSDGHTHEAEVFSRIVDPTCTEPGSEGANCTICGEYFTRDIAPLGHDLEWSIQELYGDLGDEVLTGTIHLTCKRNPYEIYDIEGTAVRTQYTAPTCDTEGSVTYNAKGEYEGFDYDVTETFKLAAHHDWVMDYEMLDGKPEVTFTCSRDGSHIYKTLGEIVGESIIQEGTCSVSGRKSIVISATDEDGHVYQKEDEIDYYAPHSLMGRYHQEGEELWEENTCANCDYISDMPLPKTLKEEQIYPCTDERDSFRTYEYHSEVWNSELEKTFYFKDHKFTEWGFAEEPTCRDEGTKAPKCSVCGELSEEGREPVQPSPEYHRFETVYDIDAHWEECSVCQEERGNHIAHAYDTVGECACGRELFEFKLNQTDTYTLKKFNCGVNEVVIPAQFKGVDVTEIGSYAFSVNLGVENDEESDIDDSDRLNRLGNVESIILPESITTIKGGAFCDCGITTFNIPASVVKIEGIIGYSVFENCSNLKSISVDPNNDVYCSYDGILYNKADDIDIYHVPQAIEGDIDILNGCWTIDSDAFANRTEMTSVNIPSSVQSIGWFSFEGCTGLKTVNIEEGIECIYGNAFNGCASLTSFTIPNSVTILYGDAFTQCENLETLTIGEGVTRIEDGEMEGCNSFTTVNWNAINCLDAGGNAYPIFAKCPKFDKVNIGEKVQTIPDYVFKDCTHLQTVNWNATNCTDVGGSWILGCTQLTTVNIGENVQTIPNHAFYDCTGLKSFNVAEGNSVYQSKDNVMYKKDDKSICLVPNAIEGTVAILDGWTHIGDYAFYNRTGLTEITIPDSVTSIGGEAFWGCTGLQTVNWNATNCTKAGSESSSIFGGCVQLTTINIGDKVQTIPNYAFSGCTGLQMITIPECVVKIDEYAFYGCTNLTAVTIPAKVIGVIPKDRFTTFTITNGEIGAGAFEGRTGLQTVTIGDGVTSIGERAFFECTGLTEITIPESVQSIGDWAFYGCTGITKVEYLGSFKVWCENGFEGYYANPLCAAKNAELYANGQKVDLVDLVISADTSKIGPNAFYGLSGITSVTIPTSVTSIGDFAFEGCTGLTEITIPDSVQSIGNYAFSDCKGLAEITIPESVQSIGYLAFYGCTEITKVNVSSLKSWCKIEFESRDANPLYAVNKEEIGKAKLYMNGVEVKDDVYIPAGTSKIGSYAFYGLSGITSITIPDSVKSIGGIAFSSCTCLAEITISDGVTDISSGAFYECYNITTATIPASAISGILQDSVTTVTITSGEIPDYAFSGCAGLQTVTIGNNVTSIDGRAFEGCRKIVHIRNLSQVEIASILSSECEVLTTEDAQFKNKIEKDENGIWMYTVGDTVYAWGYDGTDPFLDLKLNTSINAIYPYAFYEPTVIKSVDIPDSVTSIGEWAFGGCISLQTATINAQSIGSYAFAGCTGLQTVTMGDNVQSIGYDAFRDCTGLTEITIPKSVTSINSSFYSCSNLQKLDVEPGNDTYMSDDNCLIEKSSGILILGCNKSVIPSYVTSIGPNAFAYCAGLTSIIIPNSVTNISYRAFFGCTGLTEIIIPESVTSISYRTFFGCTGLTSIVISDSVTSIGQQAFYGCTGLQTVYYGGTSEQWNDISIDDYNNGNDSLINAKRYYFSEQPNYDGEHWHWNEQTHTPEVWVKEN